MANPIGASGMSRQLRFGADLHISAAGMNLQRRRMKIISENIANANATSSSPNLNPYRRKILQAVNRVDKNLGVPVVQVREVSLDQKDFPRFYRPQDPGADAEGYVKQSNVQVWVEMGDMQDANIAYSANLKAYENTRNMFLKSMSLIEP
jgi:flagellar basal-body rod protein FlgC